ncbi:MAG: ACT domain-containing protein [Methanospirillum sp.]|nr:ACT domain-containing protein [Methanospirillum sp.]
MTMITLGPEGTFSHELALMFDRDIILESSIGRVFREVVSSGIPGLVPLENSEAGGVVATMDGLMQYPVYITAETYIPVSHAFASDLPQDQISVLFAHPQTHEQCSRFIDLLGIPVIHTESNAASAVAQKNRPGSGAVISENLAQVHGIPVITAHVENNPDNITRFICITREWPEIGDPEKCSLIIDPDENRAGLLYDLLTPFKETGVNLTRIESRPSKRSMGRYVFFIDLECKGAWREAMKRLNRITRVKPLGCYSCIGNGLCR